MDCDEVNWGEEAHRLALLELVENGVLRRRRGQAAVWEHLEARGWVQPATRRGEVALAPRRQGDLTLLLERVWPAWAEVRDALTAENLPPTPAGARELRRRRRTADLDAAALDQAAWPGALNQRTAMSLLADSSKATPTPAHLDALAQRRLTRDNVVRLRPHAGLELVRAGRRHDAAELAALQGEVVLTERALASGTTLAGAPPRLIVTVENTGAFVDLPPLPGLLVVHVPGGNAPLARALLARVPGRTRADDSPTPCVHFGDLDPNGVRIYRHLAAHLPDLGWLAPAWWADAALPSPALRRPWPDAFRDDPDLPPVIRRLVAEDRWLEQEQVVLDPRLTAALEELMG